MAVQTREDDPPRGRQAAPGRPGVLVLYGPGGPVPLRVTWGPTVTIGRDHGELRPDDERVSGEHAFVEYRAGSWSVRDLGSRNGTFVDAAPVKTWSGTGVHVLRVGHTLALLLPDASAIDGAAIEVRDDLVVGPTLRAQLDRVARTARVSRTLLLRGETGVGKELAARAFHRAGPASSGPFVAVNCATIPAGLAERLLFGTRKGAYSGADADAGGTVQAADGGTLFLDELAELHAEVQGKLLRLLESREVTPLGGSRPAHVDVRVCAATHADLRAEVARGSFREDLYHRLGRPAVALPALRERLEEIPALLRLELAAAHASIQPHPTFVEQCLIRQWPGNVRELRGAARDAVDEAIAAGRDTLLVEDLADEAGLAFDSSERSERPAKDAITAALRRAGGNVSAAARDLGVHRTQLRRWIDRMG